MDSSEGEFNVCISNSKLESWTPFIRFQIQMKLGFTPWSLNASPLPPTFRHISPPPPPPPLFSFKCLQTVMALKEPLPPSILYFQGNFRNIAAILCSHPQFRFLSLFYSIYYPPTRAPAPTVITPLSALERSPSA